MSEQIFNVVLGTAGHIDHGKSSLVQALTGIHPDRLKEEQDRGITIDLGFAPLQLSNGLRVGIIDVPGHERFIKNMVAGASGIDFVVMVIAADDGVMAQTREHLQIVQLLGVRDGLTVITKKDLVEPDYLELVQEDIKQLEDGTVLAGKPIIGVSSKTGEGIDVLKKELERALSKLGRRASEGPFRMPIQRVFAKEGFGTVVTGVPLSGHVAIGDTLEVLPPGYQGRVKGLHAYKMVISQGQAGHSTAVNLHGPDIDKKEVVRGMVAATPGIFRPGTLFTAQLTHLPGTPWPLKHRAPVRFHSGTAEIQGKVLLLDGDQMAPGSSGWIQILLEDPTVLAPGDHYILRHQTPMVTLGGGRIVDAAQTKRKRNDPAVLNELEQRLKSLDNAEDFLAHLLASAELPKTLADLCSETGRLQTQVADLLRKLEKKTRAVALKAEAVYLAPATLDTFLKTLVSCTFDYLKEHPALGSVERPELRRRLCLKLGDEIGDYFDDLLDVARRKNLLNVESNTVAPPGRERKLEGALAQQAEQVEAAYKNGGLAPPSPAEIEAQLKIAPKLFKEIMRYLLETGKVVDAAPDVVFHATAYEKAKNDTLALFKTKPENTTSEIRQHLGMTRKYAVPLVELFDRKGLTVRVGDQRKLKS
ncbi:MAG TPA: selenocysteine-specific translation elongation factor [Planctomycetota bacterium]|nr:selenocysteine-specific translation elongation factor [Planctomycetota bacterium]